MNLKNRLFISFFLLELQELEVRICVQPNSPIIILILLNGFHKFVMFMGPNTSVTGTRQSGTFGAPEFWCLGTRTLVLPLFLGSFSFITSLFVLAML